MTDIQFEATSVTVALHGELDMLNAGRLYEVIAGFIERGARAVTLDFADVQFIDTSGLGVLVHVHRQVDLRIVGAHGKPLRSIELLGLDDLISINDTGGDKP